MGGRRAGLDIARIVAVLGVIAIHTWSVGYDLELGSTGWWTANILVSASRWAVPVFVMISGGLLLGKSEPAAAFYRKRLLRVGIPVVFWITAYFVFRATFLEERLTADTVIRDVALARPFTHLYFLYIIVGLYVATPLLRYFTTQTSRRAVSIAAAVLLLIPAVESMLPYSIGSGGGVTGLTYWVTFLGYYLAGYALSGLRLRGSWRFAWAIFALLAAQAVLAYLVGGTDWRAYPAGYFSVLVIPAALVIYGVCAREIDEPRTHTLLAEMGVATFGVFLVHEMVLYWHVITFVQVPPEEIVMARIPSFFVTVVVSFAVVLTARRIPFIRTLT